MSAADGREPDDLRPLTFERDYTEFAAGLGARVDGQDPGAVHRVGRRAACRRGCGARARAG